MNYELQYTGCEYSPSNAAEGNGRLPNKYYPINTLVEMRYDIPKRTRFRSKRPSRYSTCWVSGGPKQDISVRACLYEFIFLGILGVCTPG